MKLPNSAQQRALIVMAHGSRAEAANQQFLALVHELKKHTPHYASVSGAFLELATPTLAEAVQIEFEKGTVQFDVYPMFFNCGKHVSKDIPDLVRQANHTYPNTDIRLLDYFGAGDQLLQAMAKHIDQQIQS